MGRLDDRLQQKQTHTQKTELVYSNSLFGSRNTKENDTFANEWIYYIDDLYFTKQCSNVIFIQIAAKRPATILLYQYIYLCMDLAGHISISHRPSQQLN